MQVSAYDEAQLAATFKSVADPARIRILATILSAGELCVCHVEGATGVSQSRASRHLTTLKRAGLVVDRREGAWVHYRVPAQPSAVVRSILATVKNAMVEHPEIRAVAKKAKRLRGDAGCERGRS